MSGTTQHAVLTAFLALWLPAAPANLRAQNEPGDRINEYVRAEMKRLQIPGFALQVLRNHRVILTANYGIADPLTGAPVTEHTSFEIASISKQFTDAAVLLLADKGILAVTDRLSKYLPDVPPAWRTITIQQLMNHTAGLRDDWDEDDAYFTSKTTNQQFFEALKASPLKFPPGSDWSYGCGPFVLGLVIERVTGMSYAQFMRESIFRPLGMTSTSVNDDSINVPGRASGFTLRNGLIQPGVHISRAARARADVGIRTTSHDLALWNAALDGSLLLSPASKKLMFTPGRLNNGEVIAHGLGWFVTPFRGHKEIAHGGRFRTGFSAFVGRYPDDSLTIIVLSNQFKTQPSEMVRAIASFYDSDYRPIHTMQPRPDSNPSRSRVAARILNALKDGSRAAELLPDVGRLGGWSREELRQELAQSSPPVFVDCQSLAGMNAKAFGTPVAANCFFRTDGDKSRYWTFSFTARGRVAYVELEQ